MALDLSYEPAEVVDTSTLSRSEWLDFRRKGIGGSDAAAVYGVSPWKTGRDLYYEKIGKEPVREDESNWVALEYGHRLEDLVAKIFTFKTGIPAFEDRAMYAHGLFPFMLADVDFLITLPDGSTGILECKTTAMSNKEQWEDGAVPFHYELQVRHYLAVMNLDVAYIACLYGNNDASFAYQRIERDLEAEEDLIQREKEFWETALSYIFIFTNQRPQSSNKKVSLPCITTVYCIAISWLMPSLTRQGFPFTSSIS